MDKHSVTELAFFEFRASRSQPTIHSITRLILNDPLCNAILVATVAGKRILVFSDDCSASSADELYKCCEIKLPLVTESSVTVVDIEVIALKAFVQVATGCISLCVLFSKSIDNITNRLHQLNIYSEHRPRAGDCLRNRIDTAMKNVQTVDLSFIPLCMCNFTSSETDDQTVLLVSGSDSLVHVFAFDQRSAGYVEAELAQMLPEFSCPSKWRHQYPMRICIKSAVDVRHSAMGCHDGCVLIQSVATQPSKKNTVLRSVRLDFTSPIADVDVRSDERLSVLIVTTLEGAFFIPNVTSESGHLKETYAPQSKDFDCLTSALTFGDNKLQTSSGNCAADWFFLVGTYGQRLLLYRFANERFDLLHHEAFPYPVFALVSIAEKDFVVLSSKGVHIMKLQVE